MKRYKFKKVSQLQWQDAGPGCATFDIVFPKESAVPNDWNKPIEKAIRRNNAQVFLEVKCTQEEACCHPFPTALFEEIKEPQQLRSKTPGTHFGIGRMRGY